MAALITFVVLLPCSVRTRKDASDESLEHLDYSRNIGWVSPWHSIGPVFENRLPAGYRQRQGFRSVILTEAKLHLHGKA